MNEIGRYDGRFQMYVDDVRSPDPRRLQFIRWLIENDRLGRPAMGPPSGDLADAAVEEATPSVDSQPSQPSQP